MKAKQVVIGYTNRISSRKNISLKGFQLKKTIVNESRRRIVNTRFIVTNIGYILIEKRKQAPKLRFTDWSLTFISALHWLLL
jgi:hypothetical protein